MAGFKPVNKIGGTARTGQTVCYHVDSGHSTLLAPGDAVLITGTSDVDGLAEVDAATAGSLITGMITAVLPNYGNLNQSGLPASTAGYVLVDTDISTVFEAIVDSSGVARTDVGSNADIVATAATNTVGFAQSNMVVNGGSYTAGSAQVRLVGLKEGNTGAGATVYIRINESTEYDTTGV